MNHKFAWSRLGREVLGFIALGSLLTSCLTSALTVKQLVQFSLKGAAVIGIGDDDRIDNTHVLDSSSTDHLTAAYINGSVQIRFKLWLEVKNPNHRSKA